MNEILFYISKIKLIQNFSKNLGSEFCAHDIPKSIFLWRMAWYESSSPCRLKESQQKKNSCSHAKRKKPYENNTKYCNTRNFRINKALKFKFWILKQVTFKFKVLIVEVFDIPKLLLLEYPSLLSPILFLIEGLASLIYK